MKTYIIDPGVMGGVQPTSRPPVLPAVGPTPGDGSLGELEVSPMNPGAGIQPEAAEQLPAHISVGPTAIAAPAPTSAPDPDRAPGGASTSNSQYSTQGPIPKG